MIILAVDNDPDRLWELVRNLRCTYPGDTIEYTHDSLMAARFAFNNRVNILFTQLKMRRMDGVKLAELIRPQNPGLKTYFMAGREEFETWKLYCKGCEYILLEHPLTIETLREITARDHSLTLPSKQKQKAFKYRRKI